MLGRKTKEDMIFKKEIFVYCTAEIFSWTAETSHDTLWLNILCDEVSKHLKEVPGCTFKYFFSNPIYYINKFYISDTCASALRIYFLTPDLWKYKDLPK